MAKMYWINFVHIYQPSWQSVDVLERITKESYEFLIHTLQNSPRFRMSLNVAGTLLESLEKIGRSDLIKDLALLHKRGQVELTGSSHFHAFLPQLPESEICRQILLQDQALKSRFPTYQREGFFIPEMAYSPRVGTIIKEMGFRWIILDPMSSSTEPKPWVKYISRRAGLAVVFRNRTLSKSYPPEALYKLLPTKQDTLIITATDGELYGHFHRDWQEHLKQILESPEIETLKVSEYLARTTRMEPLQLRSASWETKRKQVHSNNPFSIWLNRSNPIHRGLWRLAFEAIAQVTSHENDPNYMWARNHLDRGLASCSWWWASEVKTSAFAPPAWSPDETEKGALELIKSVRSLDTLSSAEKLKAEKIYFDTIQAVWKKHWNSYGKK